MTSRRCFSVLLMLFLGFVVSVQTQAESTGIFIAKVVLSEDYDHFDLRLIQDGVRATRKKSMRFDEDALIHELPSGRYAARLFSKDRAHNYVYDQSDSIRAFYIKKDTINYLGSLEVKESL